MKRTWHRPGVTYAAGFWGTAAVAVLSWLAGNGWVTVYERAAVSFLVLVSVSIAGQFAVESILKSDPQTKGTHFDQTLPEEVPLASSSFFAAMEQEEFIPWQIPPADPSHQNPSHSK